MISLGVLESILFLDGIITILFLFFIVGNSHRLFSFIDCSELGTYVRLLVWLVLLNIFFIKINQQIFVYLIIWFIVLFLNQNIFIYLIL